MVVIDGEPRPKSAELAKLEGKIAKLEHEVEGAPWGPVGPYRNLARYDERPRKRARRAVRDA